MGIPVVGIARLLEAGDGEGAERAFALAGLAVFRASAPEARLAAGLVLVLASMAVLQYLTSILANGIEGLSRHLFFFNALMDLLLIAGAAAALARGSPQNSAATS